MNKTFGLKADYTYVYDDVTRTIVCYDYEEVDDIHATWREVIFYKKQGLPTTQMAKDGIIENINECTREKILSGFVWNDIRVWLSEENQINFNDIQNAATLTNGEILPLKVKLGEGDGKEPIYYEFKTLEELNDFYKAKVLYVQECLKNGWDKKDSIDWTLYESLNALPEVIVEGEDDDIEEVSLEELNNIEEN